MGGQSSSAVISCLIFLIRLYSTTCNNRSQGVAVECAENPRLSVDRVVLGVDTYFV